MRTNKSRTRNSTPIDPRLPCARRENLARISEWCADTYVAPGEDRRQVYDKTQIYLKDALHLH